MTLETSNTLRRLHKERETVSRKWDEASRKELLQYLESYLKSGKFSDEFFQFCGKKFPSERLGSKDKGKLTPAGVKKIVNEIVEAVKKPSSKSDKKEEK